MDFLICDIHIKMISGSKGQKAVRACTIRLLNLGPAKHEEAAIYAVNQRIPNVLELRELFYSGAIYAVALTIAKLDSLVDIGHSYT